jgi:hypothetical protein
VERRATRWWRSVTDLSDAVYGWRPAAIAGKAMPEIPSLDLPLLERSDAAE